MSCFFDSQCSISNTVELISLEPNATMSSPNSVPQRPAHVTDSFSGQNSRRNTIARGSDVWDRIDSRMS